MSIQFDYRQPTRLIFGANRIEEIGPAVKGLGQCAMLVITPAIPKFLPEKIQIIVDSLQSVGIRTIRFQQVKPNPTLDDIQAGATLARAEKVDFVIGMGGGSAMDTARAIAVAATHPGTAMDYLYFSATQPTEATLPMMMIPTTSGTGSHMSCCAVLTDEARKFKSALWNRDRLFAQIAIVDPTLMLTLPLAATAATGFDVFTHLFESYINVNHNPIIDMVCLDGIRIVVKTLPALLDDLGNLELRSALAYADTLAGIAIANVGTTLPHAMGQPISGHCPHVSHGLSLAVIYPEFMRYTAPAAEERFATVGAIFDPALAGQSTAQAAAGCCRAVDRYLETAGLLVGLDDLNVPVAEMEAILDHCMEFPDVTVNPRVPTREQVAQLYAQARQSRAHSR
jgi:alcohol dehydrogenase class IV